jgi:serine/threonine protein kinase/beta-lactam-binding protein with PASTA domain
MATLTDTIGRVLSGRYRIDAALGTGASAHVYLATDVTLKRRVAIKMLHPVLAADRSFLKRFRAEAQAAASLTHPNLVAVYDWGEDSDGPYLVLEYLAGGSLRDLLDDSPPLGAAHVAGIGAQAAHGLAYAHARGFVHRDVKPANLLFDDERRRLCVADFGLARALAEAAWTEPVGATLGTARYAAPEQAQGKRVDGRTDVYALCLVLYEAITGSVPFVSDTTIGTLMARVGAPLPGHDALGPLDAILRAGAAPEPDERLTAAELARRLSEVARSLPRPGTLPEGRPKRTWRPYDDDLENESGSDDDAATGAASGQGARARAGANGSGRSGGDEFTGNGGGSATGSRNSEPDTGSDAMAIAEAIGIAQESSIPKSKKEPIRSDDMTEIGAPPGMVVGPGLTDATDTTQTNGAASGVAGGAGVGAGVGAGSGAGGGLVDGVEAGGRTETPKSTVLRATRRRRWPWVVLVLVLLAGLAAGALLVAQKRYQVFTPSHPVPSILGLTKTSATTVVAKDHFNVKITGTTYDVKAPKGTIVSQSPKPGSVLKQGTTITVVASAGPPPVNVPNLQLITSGGCGAAKAALADDHLGATCAYETSITVKAGAVVSYTPTTQVLYGGNVNVLISTGLPQVAVPNLAGKSKAEATAALTTAKFAVAVGTSQYSSTVPAGEVLAGWTGQGKTLLYGSTVTISISLGHAPVQIPNVIGDSQSKAIAALQKAGLVFQAAYGPNNDPVFTTDPAVGKTVPYGTPVSIYLGANPG